MEMDLGNKPHLRTQDGFSQFLILRFYRNGLFPLPKSIPCPVVRPMFVEVMRIRGDNKSESFPLIRYAVSGMAI